MNGWRQESSPDFKVGEEGQDEKLIHKHFYLRWQRFLNLPGDGMMTLQQPLKTFAIFVNATIVPCIIKTTTKKITSQILKSTYSREFVPRLSQGRLAICFISFFFPLECYLKKKIGKPEVCGDGCEIPQCILNCKLKKTGYWVQQKNIFMPLSFLTSLMIWHAKARSFPQMALRVSFLQHSFLHVRTVI